MRIAVSMVMAMGSILAVVVVSVVMVMRVV
jgi:hypothetical protein